MEWQALAPMTGFRGRVSSHPKGAGCDPAPTLHRGPAWAQPRRRLTCANPLQIGERSRAAGLASVAGPRPGRVHGNPQQLAAGGVTPGWLPLVVDYGLLAPVPAPGEYRGVVTYTLTQP